MPPQYGGSIPVSLCHQLCVKLHVCVSCYKRVLTSSLQLDTSTRALIYIAVLTAHYFSAFLSISLPSLLLQVSLPRCSCVWFSEKTTVWQLALSFKSQSSRSTDTVLVYGCDKSGCNRGATLWVQFYSSLKNSC